MKYDIKAIQEASKRRYIDLGLIVLPSRVSEMTGMQSVLEASNAVRRSNLPKASTKSCVDCGRQAAHWHHYISYERVNWLDVIPLCASCHYSLHNKLESGVFYNFGLKISVAKYLSEDTTISVDLLTKIHGATVGDIHSVVYNYSIPNTFMEQFLKERVGADKPTKEVLQELYIKCGSTPKVADVLGVVQSVIYRWLIEYSIPTNESSYDRSNRLRPPDDILLQYLYERRTQACIAELLSVSQSTVSKWIKEAKESKHRELMVAGVQV